MICPYCDATVLSTCQPERMGAMAEREAVARLVCCGHGGCLYQGDSEDGEKCYCDTTDFNGSGVEKTTDAIVAALAAIPAAALAEQPPRTARRSE